MAANINKQYSFSLSYLLVAVAVFLLLQSWLSPRVYTVSYTQFKNHVAAGKINSVVISTT
jgi:hypothetical protein